MARRRHLVPGEKIGDYTLVRLIGRGGMSSVFEVTPTRFRMIAQNQLGDESFSSPAICGSRVYLRGAKKGPTRQEYLWCVGE